MKEKLRFLVLEDDASDLDLMIAELNRLKLDFEAYRANSKEEFLEKLRTLKPDLILVDHSLDIFDGQAALALAQSESPATPLIFVSGTADEDAAVEAMRCGAVDFVRKDRLGRLGPAVRRALREADERAERARKEASFRERESRYHTILKETGQVVYDYDFSTGHIQWDGAVEEVLSYTREEMQAANVQNWEENIHPDDRPQVLAVMDKAIKSGQRYHMDYRFRSKDGGYILVEDHGSFHFDAQGNIARMVGTLNNITERKKLEAQFLRAQRMESIGTLASGMAHDLNNMLAPILMGCQLLGDCETENDRRHVINLISMNAQRGAELVKQVLSFCRGAEGRRTELRVRSVIRETEVLRDTFPKSIKIETRTAPDLWKVMADPTQLHQVLLNLSVNARDAMPNGGTLTISAENLWLDSQFALVSGQTERRAHVMISVADTGVGIPPELREKVFDPFFTTKDVGKGTGLGLSTSLAIVKSHGGFINLYSEPGRGTVFKVYLPAITDGHGTSLLTREPQLPRGNGELILLVDDELAIRTVTRQTLQTYGYNVITAGDGAEALELYMQRGNEVAALLTDMMMPGMDGPAAIQALKRVNPKLKVIATSGLSPEAHMAKSPADSVSAFLAKPYTAEALLKTLAEVLKETQE